MKPALIPANEAGRLAALARYRILDTLPETEFDNFTLLASQICEAPISAISLIDRGRQWFKSKLGLDVAQTTRAVSFCAHAIHGKELFEVRDAIEDERFNDNPLVTGAPDIRFYAGVPLITWDGYCLGTLCVIDRAPRELLPRQREALIVLAIQVMGVLERRAAVFERQQVELERDRFFSLSLDLHCIVGVDGYFKRVNPAFSEVLGYSTDEILERPLIDFVHPEDRAAALERIFNLTNDVYPAEFENRCCSKDGSIKWMYWRVTPGLAQGLVYAIARDVTARQQSQAQMITAKEDAQLANRAKSTFLATMSHEIRTPMNGMLGLLELLSLSKLDAEQQCTLDMVRDSGNSLLRIIDDILDFSKIEAGKLEVRPEAASIRHLIENVHNIYSGNASAKGMRIVSSADPAISPAVLVDPVRLRQILNNFVSNALKFTSKGTIEIKAELIERRDGEDRVRFSVADTGVGVSEANQKLLFQPFSQGDADTTRQYGGTGLGLTICRRLATMMGGTVDMVSELGKGTVMILTLSLPVADAGDLERDVPDERQKAFMTTTGMRRIAPAVEDAETEGTLVLVADDHPTNRALLVRQVNKLGYAAESADGGLQALEKWKSGRFGAVITDCQMPDMDGYDLARSIRGMESGNGGRRIPIIACTANVMGGEVEKCMACGMDDYLAKPVRLGQLLEKLDLWLPIPHEAQVLRALATAPTGVQADAPVATQEAPVDCAFLSATWGHAGSVSEVLREFRKANDLDADVLKAAVAARDLSRVTYASHRMGGAGKTIGAQEFSRICQAIENAGRTGNWKEIHHEMDAFEAGLLRMNSFISSF